jgi:hypothetical protein
MLQQKKGQQTRPILQHAELHYATLNIRRAVKVFLRADSATSYATHVIKVAEFAEKKCGHNFLSLRAIFGVKINFFQNIFNLEKR